jgi:hypothetical protein
MIGWRRSGAALWLVAACAAAAVVTWIVLPPPQVIEWMGETGPVEILTAATYALCAVAVWALRTKTDDWRSTLALSTVMASFCMRELDWHKAFTGSSVLRLSWYYGPASPQAKAVAALCVLAFAAALVWLVVRHARTWWRGLRGLDPVAVTVGLFFAALVVAKTLDRSVAILIEDFGVHVPLTWVALRSALEEWLELALSVLVLLGLFQHRAAVTGAR